MLLKDGQNCLPQKVSTFTDKTTTYLFLMFYKNLEITKTTLFANSCKYSCKHL